MSVVETVEKQIEETYEMTRDNLITLKNTAYQKYCDTWDSMEHIKDTTLETITSAWEQAWISYNNVVKQLQDYGHSSIEKAQSEYDTAKTNLAERTKEIRDWISEHGEKWKEDANGLQADAYEKMGYARKEAYEKYLQSKEGLKSLFSEAHQEASKDLEAAENNIKKATSRLEKHLTITPSDETKDEWEKTKAKLESTKQRAQTEFEEAKAHAESLGARVSGWTHDVMNTLKDESEFLTQRAKEIGDNVAQFASDSKEKVEETTESASNVLQDKWNAIYKASQDESTYALEMWNKAKESLANFWHSAQEAVGMDVSEIVKTPEIKEHHASTEDKEMSEIKTEKKEESLTEQEPVIPEGSGVLLQG